MLTVVKNQIKVVLFSVKYALMREMLNKATFLTNILFMILNNASFIIQWLILYSIKNNVGGYTFKQVMLLWAIAAGTYGFSHFFFARCYHLSDMITDGKLDVFLVQPKNVLLSAITSDVEVSAIGDIFYAVIMCFIVGLNYGEFLLFLFFIICGGLIMTSFSVILNSLSFWFQKADMIAEIGTGFMTNFATYPEGIFKGVVKILLFTMIPVGIVSYLPVRILTTFHLGLTLFLIAFTVIIIFLAFTVFYRGLKRYSSGNLMSARI